MALQETGFGLKGACELSDRTDLQDSKSLSQLHEPHWLADSFGLSFQHLLFLNQATGLEAPATAIPGNDGSILRRLREVGSLSFWI